MDDPSSNNKTLNARLLARTQACHRSYIIAARTIPRPLAMASLEMRPKLCLWPRDTIIWH